MSTFPPALSGRMRLQHAVVAAEQLAASGITARQQQTLVRTGLLNRLHQGVYASTAVRLTLEARCLAACLAVPDLVISGPTAARLRNLRKIDSPDVHAIMLHGPTRLDGVVVHRTNQLDFANDVETRPEGIRLLRPARLAFDLARFLDDGAFESVIEQMIDRRLSNIPRFFAAGPPTTKAWARRVCSVCTRSRETTGVGEAERFRSGGPIAACASRTRGSTGTAARARTARRIVGPP